MNCKVPGLEAYAFPFWLWKGQKVQVVPLSDGVTSSLSFVSGTEREERAGPRWTGLCDIILVNKNLHYLIEGEGSAVSEGTQYVFISVSFNLSSNY